MGHATLCLRARYGNASVKQLQGGGNAIQLGPPCMCRCHIKQRALCVVSGSGEQLVAGAAIPKGVERACRRVTANGCVVLFRRDDAQDVLGLPNANSDSLGLLPHPLLVLCPLSYGAPTLPCFLNATDPLTRQILQSDRQRSHTGL
jgi:hypothetical protein